MLWLSNKKYVYFQKVAILDYKLLILSDLQIQFFWLFCYYKNFLNKYIAPITKAKNDKTADNTL